MQDLLQGRGVEPRTTPYQARFERLTSYNHSATIIQVLTRRSQANAPHGTAINQVCHSHAQHIDALFVVAIFVTDSWSTVAGRSGALWRRHRGATQPTASS